MVKITPVHKSGSKNDINNYRPISLLPIISNVLERVVQVQLLDFIRQHKILLINQSTETTVVFLVDKILQCMDKQQLTGSVFIDLKKAFEVVNHEYLLYKLNHNRVRNSSLDWFCDYLTTQTQKIAFGRDLFTSSSVQYGMPQGSILGPLLFIYIYINDLPQCLEKCSISMYMDDTVIYFSAVSINDIQCIVQRDLENIMSRMNDNELILNEIKTKTMLFGTRQKLGEDPKFDIYLNGIKLDQIFSFNYLGVIMIVIRIFR